MPLENLPRAAVQLLQLAAVESLPDCLPSA